MSLGAAIRNVPKIGLAGLAGIGIGKISEDISPSSTPNLFEGLGIIALFVAIGAIAFFVLSPGKNRGR